MELFDDRGDCMEMCARVEMEMVEMSEKKEKGEVVCEDARQTPIGVIPKSQLPNPKITTDDGGELLVSPEHRVYGTIVDQTNPSSSFNSGVDTTGTLFSTISLNSGSLDQILTSMPDDLYFKANAVYGKSSGGEIFLASSRNSEYSSLGTGSIFLNHKCLLALLTSLPSSLACSSVNSLSFRISLAIENCISSKNSVSPFPPQIQPYPLIQLVLPTLK